MFFYKQPQVRFLEDGEAWASGAVAARLGGAVEVSLGLEYSLYQVK